MGGSVVQPCSNPVYRLVIALRYPPSSGKISRRSASPLLPYCLKHIGFVSLDPYHPSHARLVYNCERESAWAVCNAFVGKVGVVGRVFAQPKGVLDFSDRVCSGLPNVTVHPIFRGSPFASWTYDSA